MNYVKKLNERFPFIKKEYSFIEGPEKVEKSRSRINKKSKAKNPNEFIKEIFYSKDFENDFERFYSPKIYNDIKIIAETKKRFPLTDVHSAIAVMKIIRDIEFNKYQNYSTLVDWLKSYSLDNNVKKIDYKFYESLTKHITARIDIKNFGISTNAVEIIENSDSFSDVTNPKWFKNESGSGTELQSEAGDIHLKLKCINDGKLVIRLKGIFFKDENNKKVPIYIKYTNFKINNETVLNKPTTCWHDVPYNFEKKVKDGEVIDMVVNWQPI